MVKNSNFPPPKPMGGKKVGGKATPPAVMPASDALPAALAPKPMKPVKPMKPKKSKGMC